VSSPDVQSLEKALIDAGVEIYRSNDREIQIAERVRLHIMDSGVRILMKDAPTVTFTVRSQRSDFPHTEPDLLFARVRESVGAQATERGYAEAKTATVTVTDPVDDAKVLDVWHEITYAKAPAHLDDLVHEVKWALGIEKYVSR
jgi:hypothetical protein